jgi:GT2 family glycosyltransferase
MTTPISKSFIESLPVSVQVQSILYNGEPDSIERALTSIARSAELALRAGACSRVRVRLGDCSPCPVFDSAQITALQKRFAHSIELDYLFFDANLGSARGHNRLAAQDDFEPEFILIQNPDAVPSPRLIERMLGCFRTPHVGMVEAKQLPIEHPKEYDAQTGETLWASTACAMIPTSLFHQLGGFDADSFFLYCDDVDFSWLVLDAGYRVIFQPAAFVLHDKRLADDGSWPSSSTERYYSAEAAMILAHKWSRSDLAYSIYKHFKASSLDYEKKAAAEFRRRRKRGLLPKQRDAEHRIAYFDESTHLYSKHRYPL